MLKVSAPGKFILFGEHAVVYGEPALAIAIDRRISVEASITSGASTMNGYALKESYHRYIIEAINQEDMKARLEMKSSSELPSSSGLGSSAAITVATVGMLKALSDKFNEKDIALRGFEVEYAVQGRASPTDTSTSAHGQAVMLTKAPTDNPLWKVERDGNSWYINHCAAPPFTFVVGYTGISGSTPEMVGKVRAFLEKKKKFAREIIEEIGQTTMDGARALAGEDMEGVGRLMNRNHDLLAILGVNCPGLQRLVDAARPHSYGAKLTGAGGGGSMIALTEKPEKVAKTIERAGGIPYIVNVSRDGVRIEK